MIRQFKTKSVEETIHVGRELSSLLAPPLLVMLRGDLGAGKTTVVKGIAEGFQAAQQDDVTSPTFTLVHEYRGPAVNLYHIDLYRVDTERELLTLGLDDLMDERSILLVEWGDKFERFRKECDLEIGLERRGDQERVITIRSVPDKQSS
jgi:tRNA threonylcarbamoyladenosine biosynthesis protein TsaE